MSKQIQENIQTATSKTTSPFNHLDDSVLVLDKNYQPVKITTAKLAIMLLFSEKTLVLDSDYNTYDLTEWIEYSRIIGSAENPSTNVLRSSKINIVVPEVIVLPTYVRKNGHSKKVKYSRMSIFRRDDYQCQYCGKKFRRPDLTVDHILPKSKGGSSGWMNITTACKPCNWKKADRTPSEAGMKLLNPPRIPAWKDTISLPEGQIKNIWSNFLDI